MSSSARSARILTLPYELLEDIVFHALDPTGPPSGLVPLLLTCRVLNARLSWRNNARLYYRIATAQFDTAAARRRFGPDADFSAPALSRHLRHTWAVLKRLRSGDLDSDSLFDDLWDAFFLAIENDGKNVRQLEWARVHSLATRYMNERLWQGTIRGWPQDTPLSALALWVLWATMDAGKYDSQMRAHTIQLVLPFVVLAFKYPRFFAPDVTYHLPLPADVMPDQVISQVNAHGPYPVFRRPADAPHVRTRFGAHLAVVPPSLAAAAIHLYFAIREMVALQVLPDLPVDWPAALAAGITTGQTQADVHEVNAHRSTRFSPRSAADMLHAPGVHRSPSALWDDDFRRIISCHDLWAQPRYRGSPYTPGSLNGLWQGRYLIPDLNGYMNLLATPDYPDGFGETSPWMSSWPVYMRLQEHHCISPATPVPVPRNADDALDNHVWNAYFPLGFGVRNDLDTLTIDVDGTKCVYETASPGRLSSHDPATCRACVRSCARAAAGPSGDRTSIAEVPLGLQDDAVDGFGDFGGAGCTGVQDIVITGETDPYHGMAWGHYRILGRVRPRDGLVVLLRIPAASQAWRPRWVFRGYVSGARSVVGAWRGAVNVQGQARSVPWEGAFAMARRDR
ncbi:hypothetical protein K488DRAFT_56422 [Vararia minispora EC-137]|uniref:Uncharacterized protein n=1 Tax=Vararia minispora EC-137 TaxID=1314806 RepID=A0ACB8QCS0_9AGAM|nr:hypothetical protein K488DRAFT_56422 [Vararia minispora EC-137]